MSTVIRSNDELNKEVDAINTEVALKLNKSQVINNLTSTSTTDALSTAQGKNLQDNKLNKSQVNNTLTSTSTTDALSAAKGTELNDKITIKGKGALLPRYAIQADPTSGVQQQMEWDTAHYDDLSFFNTATRTRFTIPSGVTKVVLSVYVPYYDNATGTREAYVHKNGVNGYAGYKKCRLNAIAVVGKYTYIEFKTPPIQVAQNDYFECYTQQDSGGALGIQTGVGGAHFGIEVIA